MIFRVEINGVEHRVNAPSREEAEKFAERRWGKKTPRPESLAEVKEIVDELAQEKEQEEVDLQEEEVDEFEEVEEEE